MYCFFTTSFFFVFAIQLDFQIRNVTMEGYSVLLCHLRPDAEYTIRLRHRYRGPASPWSMWSKALQGRTAEDGERKWLLCFCLNPLLDPSNNDN